VSRRDLGLFLFMPEATIPRNGKAVMRIEQQQVFYRRRGAWMDGLGEAEEMT